MDPAFLPFVRSLTVTAVTVWNNGFIPLSNITHLLPQLNALIILDGSSASIAQCVTLSTSLKLLSLPLYGIGNLNSDTQAIIRDRIEELRIVIDDSWPSHGPLSAIVNGRRVIKKVIVD
jgi:hypothetical protein